MNETEPQTARIRVMVVEDQGLMRAFFERWLERLPGYQLVGAARTGEDGLSLVGEERPDVALVDYQLPGMDGLAFSRAARQVRPQLRTLVVSSLMDPLALTRIRESGVEGYVEKDASPDLLAEALSAVAAGENYFSERFRSIMAREAKQSESVGKILSRREQQVLGFVLARETSRVIAERMGLSARTVEFHRANLMTKLDARTFAELETAALMRGWTAGR